MADLFALYEVLEQERLAHVPHVLNREEEEILRLADRDGDVIASFWLGGCLLSSERIDEGIALLNKASQAGVGAAIGALATYQFWLESTPQCPWRVSAKVLEGWRAAAEREDYAAQFMLSEYGDGADPPLRDSDMKELLLSSAKAGFNDALLALGEAYAEGRMGTPDLPKATELFSRARRANPQLASATAWLILLHLGEGGACDEAACSLVRAYALAYGSYWEGFAAICEEVAMLYLTRTRFRPRVEDRISRALPWLAYASAAGDRSSESSALSLIRQSQRTTGHSEAAPMDLLLRRSLEEYPSEAAQHAIQRDAWARRVLGLE